MANLEEISAKGINDNFIALNNELATKAELKGSSEQVFNVEDATASTEAINKGQLDKAVDAINTEISSIATKVDKLLSNGYRFPDYSNGESKDWETTYTAESDGWLRVYLSCSDPLRAYLYINGVVACSIGTSNGIASSSTTTLPINQGDIYIGTGGTGNSVMTFYLAKGVD